MKTDDLDLDNLFTTDGKDVWRMVSFCTEPTCRLAGNEKQKRNPRKRKKRNCCSSD